MALVLSWTVDTCLRSISTTAVATTHLSASIAWLQDPATFTRPSDHTDLKNVECSLLHTNQPTHPPTSLLGFFFVFPQFRLDLEVSGNVASGLQSDVWIRVQQLIVVVIVAVAMVVAAVLLLAVELILTNIYER